MIKAMIQFAILSTLSGSGFIVSAAESADNDKQFEHGKKMHSEHCYKCHTEKVYTRDNRLVKSLDALSKQVVQCRIIPAQHGLMTTHGQWSISSTRNTTSFNFQHRD